MCRGEELNFENGCLGPTLYLRDKGERHQNDDFGVSIC